MVICRSIRWAKGGSGRWRGRTVRGSCFVLAVLLLQWMIGCGKTEQSERSLPPLAIMQGDECHVCGMIITGFPGPKGEAYQRGDGTPLKFCSTRDLFSFLLQPENEVNVTQVYVHDMGITGWEHPADDAFIDAISAWYVADHPRVGAMGPTLASFAREEDARAFAERHGGRLLRFEDIDLEILATLRGGTDRSHEQR